jgi:hypothetical protein
MTVGVTGRGSAKAKHGWRGRTDKSRGPKTPLITLVTVCNEVSDSCLAFSGGSEIYKED